MKVGLCTGRALFRVAVPSDTSIDIYEALELRDGDKLRWSLATPGSIDDEEFGDVRFTLVTGESLTR